MFKNFTTQQLAVFSVAMFILFPFAMNSCTKGKYCLDIKGNSIVAAGGIFWTEMNVNDDDDDGDSIQMGTSIRIKNDNY